MLRRGAPAAFVAMLLILSQVVSVAAAPGASGGQGGRSAGQEAAPIQRGLQKDILAGTTDTIVVEFSGKADLKPAKQVKDRTKRGQAVLTALTATAAKSQAAARTVVAGSRGATASSYWLTNVMVVQSADPKTLEKLTRDLAKVRGVTTVRAEKVYPLVKPVETKIAILAAAGDPEWGVAKIRADEAWADGILGQGIVVANVDTGVDYLHPALVDHYRGNDGSGGFTHDYNWWDPTGVCGDEPCDNAAHGTHTMGTMVGGDGPGPFTPDTGVAPGAQWIAAKGCEDFGCSESSLLSSGQFILAPTDLAGENPDPSRRPDIVNNSWGSGPGDPFYLETVQAWRAAGIIPVFSSGNPGPFCGEGGSPGDFLESFSVGATDDGDLIADFSGRGPSVYGKVNPDVAAPGVDVVSTVPGGGYEAFSGTSMAAPHVAGTLALMLSAEVALRGDVAASTDALRTTALDILDDSCGGDEDGDPNNVYGDGRIDAKAAVDLVATGGTLAGTITDDVTADPIAGARVTANDSSRQFTVVTDASGDFDLFLAAGTYLVTVDAFGYAPGVATDVVIATDVTTLVNIALTPLPRFDLTGTVRTAEDATPIEGAGVIALGTPLPAAITNAAGAYTLNLPIGTYAIRGSAGGCTEVQVVEDVVIADATTLDFALGRKLDGFGHGCRPIGFDWVDATTNTALYGDEWVGRLALPFAFDFYGASYEQVFLSDNGYVNFLTPDQYNMFPISIPSAFPPNAAIYALWRDLYLDEGSTVSYATVGSPGARAFVLEYDNARVRGATSPVDFEIKIHEGGETVDLLYGANAANAGDGRGATIGIEDAEGTDALEFSFSEGLLTPNSAFRFELVPSGFVRGTVTDANDGEPINGATVSGAPGLGSTKTAADGTYALRLYPGSYDVTIAAGGYVSETSPVAIVDGGDVTLDASLDAPIPVVDPTTIEVELAYGADPVDMSVTLSNTGSAPLTWEAKERSRGSSPPVIGEPEGEGAFIGTAGNGIRLQRNGGGTAIAVPRAYRWTAAKPTADMNILIYADDPIHPAPDTFTDQALQRLGLSYTAYYDADFGGFTSALESGSWDLVIFANDNWFPDFTVFDALNSYVEGGGRLILDTWVVEFDPGHPLWATLGYEMTESVFEQPVPVYWWQPDHPAFTFPEVAPEWTEVDTIGFGIYGQRGNATEGAESLAGYTTPGPDKGQAALVIANEDRTAFKAFMDAQNSADLDGDGVLDGVELWENLAFGIGSGFFSDVPWLSEDPTSGILVPGVSTGVSVTIGDPTLVPGEYRGTIAFLTDAPKPRNVTVDVTLTVALPDSWGGISGTVTDAHSGEPLSNTTVTLHSQWAGGPLDVTATTDGEGAYQIIGPSGTWPLEFAREGYVGLTRDEAVEAGSTRTGVDASLHAEIPHSLVEGGPLEFILTEGRTGNGTVTVSNPEGHADLDIQVGEVDLGGPSSTTGLPAATGARTLPAGVDRNARTTRGFGTGRATAVPPRLAADGDVLASWPAGMTLPWGVASSGDVWLSDPADVIDVQFTAEGERLNEFALDWAGEWGADMAFDAGRNLIWQVNVGGDNGIYGLDPTDGSVEQVITGSPWDSISQRGLAYDPDADVFYIGGWNEGIVYRVAGPSHPTPGETLNECSPPEQAISGLAWNRSFGLLWEATNSEQDTIWLIDPMTCEALRGIPHPDGGGFAGAGLELDVVGNLWTVGQGSGNAYLVESGLPTFSDVPWLTVDPTEATVAPDGSVDIDVTVDTTGLEPGVHRAIVVLLTNDPDASVVQVPVTVAVPAYQQGVNAGGGAAMNTNGDAFAADRAYTGGSFGYVGGSTSSTSSPISGTEDDVLYRDLRQGMSAYRFDVPDGTYRVDLLFADLKSTKAGQRVQGVNLEGQWVLAYLDVFAEAGGKNAALYRSFVVTVADGRIDIDFRAEKGDKPIINAILVTELPEGAPGA